MSLNALVLCRCGHPQHTHLHHDECGDCDCAYFFDNSAWLRWCHQVYEAKTTIPVFNRWANQWLYDEKKFDGDCGPVDFENFLRRVAPPYRKPKQLTLLGDGWTMLLRVVGQSGEIISTLRQGGEPPDAEEEAIIDAIESLVLAHACAGVDVQNMQYIEGLNTTINTIFS